MFERILVPVDLQSPAFANNSMEVALAEAKAHTDQSTLCIMSVLPGFNMPIVANFFPEDAMKLAIDNAKAVLADYAKEKVPADIPYDVVVSVGTAHEKVLDQAKKINADLIVIPSHTPKSYRSSQFLLGSCAHKIVEYAQCTVTVVRQKTDS